MDKIFTANLVIYMLISVTLNAKNNPVNREKYRLRANRVSKSIKVDGILDEEIWQHAENTTPFFRIQPVDTGYAIAQTEVMVAYDDSYIYMGITNFDPSPGKRPVESYRRDWSFNNNDNFFAAIDTYNDQTNGFVFGVNAVGAQWDGMQSNGGMVALEWDGKWYSAVKNYNDRWTAEFKIPFQTIRYEEGVTEWGINFSRLDLKTNEKSSWAPVPRQFASATLAYTGTLEWETPPPPSGVRVSLIPYTMGRATHDKEAGAHIDYRAGAGLDAKVILSTSTNLDVTINPDYSQVEVDRQVTNLDRFELYFPEKRKFFLENSDLFASLGSSSIRPFFSRRIGLDSPIIAGARFSGNAGDNLRIGLMNVQTAANDLNPADNFSVAVLQQRILSHSNVGVFMTNKNVIVSPKDSVYEGYLFNRVAGGEFNYASMDNNWTGKIFYHHSFNSSHERNSDAAYANITYATQKFNASLKQSYVGGNYLAEMGYIKRTGYLHNFAFVDYQFYPNSLRITSHGPSIKSSFYFEPDMKLTDREFKLEYSLTWYDRSVMVAGLENDYVRLLDPFDPTNTEGVKIPSDAEFRWIETYITYNSTQKRLFTYKLEGRYGGYFGGRRTQVNTDMNYRIQPYGSISLVSSYNKILLPEPYASRDLILLGPKIDITFSEKLFFTTFVQFNNQIENVNLNMRLQWRFAPVSDLYIVYTENAYPVGWQTKNRGIVLKLSYWFN